MAVTLTLDAFYESVPIQAPATFTLIYTLTWDSTEGWTTVNLLVWGPQGVFTDTFTPSLSNVTLTHGGATVTRTVTVAQNATYTPLVQDGTFQTGTPWTIVNGSLVPGNVTLNNGGTITQNLVLQPGTYKINVSSTGTIGLKLNGLAYTNNTNVTLDETPVTLVITSTGTSNVTAVAVTGTPTFADLPDPCYVAATDQNHVVQAAVYLTNVAPTTGSPQSTQSPVVVTPLTSALVPVSSAPLQPSSELNN